MRMRVGSPKVESDRAETVLRSLDEKMGARSGISVFHVLTAASILGSLLLFLRGRKMEGIFVGLWPPTFEALRSAAKRR